MKRRLSFRLQYVVSLNSFASQEHSNRSNTNQHSNTNARTRTQTGTQTETLPSKGVRCPACDARSKLNKLRAANISVSRFGLENVVSSNRRRRTLRLTERYDNGDTYDSSPRRRLSFRLTTSRKFREVRDVTKKNLLSMKQVFRLIEEEARVVIYETSSSPRKNARKRVKKVVILPDKVEDVEVDRALEIVLTATRIRRGRHGAFAIKELINLAIFIVSSLQSGRYKSLEKNLRAAMDMFCGNDDTMMMTKSMGDNTTRTRSVLFSLLDPNVANRERETKLANRGKRKTFKPCIRLSANGKWLGPLASKVVRAPLPSSVFDLVTIPDRDCRVRFKHRTF